MAWSFFPQALEGMRAAEPRVPCALLVAAEAIPAWPEMRYQALSLGAQGVSVFFLGIHARVTEDCRRSGLALYSWTADQEPQIQRLIELDVDGICTNYPDRAVALLAG
jgi:glycerophosphoryl diester phosphodiesterase